MLIVKFTINNKITVNWFYNSKELIKSVSYTHGCKFNDWLSIVNWNLIPSNAITDK